MRCRPRPQWLLLAMLVAVLAAPFATWGEAGDGGPESVVAAASTAATGRALAAPELDTSTLRDVLHDTGPAVPETAGAHEQASGAVVAPPPPAPAPPPPAVVTAPPPAPAPAPPSGQVKGEQALAMISYPWQTLGYEMVFLPPVTGLRARILRIERRIEVDVRPGDSVAAVASDIAHEIGHAIDFTLLAQVDRDEWKLVRGMNPDEPWYGCSGCSDYATPAGDWAESFAVWQVGGASRSEMAPQPTREQLAVLARIGS